MGWLKEAFSKAEKQFNIHVHVPWIISTGCCRIELENTQSSTYDWRRLGMNDFANSPCDANVLVVAGWINLAMAEQIKSAFECLVQPKYVIAVGTCSLSGAPYTVKNETAVLASELVPVDVFVPGCPPRPELILDAIRELKKRIDPGPEQRKVLYRALREGIHAD